MALYRIQGHGLTAGVIRHYIFSSILWQSPLQYIPEMHISVTNWYNDGNIVSCSTIIWTRVISAIYHTIVPSCSLLQCWWPFQPVIWIIQNSFFSNIFHEENQRQSDLDFYYFCTLLSTA